MIFVAELSIVFMYAFLLSTLLFVGYILYLRSAVSTETRIVLGFTSRLHILGLTVLALLIVESSRRLIQAELVAYAALLLCIGWIIIAIYYLQTLRRVFLDERIRYSLMILAGVSQLVCINLFFLYWAGNRLNFDLPFKIDGQAFSQLINNFVGVVGIVLAAAMIVVTNFFNAKQARISSGQQIYQTLEIQSIELFRFEAAHPELVQRLWFSGNSDLGKDKAATRYINKDVSDYLVRQYICQILNLFEMAFRFRKDNIVPRDVYGSWVIWMWELCSEPEFQNCWRAGDALGLNYVGEFRAIVDNGVELARATQATGSKTDAEKAMNEFASSISKALGNCAVLDFWFSTNTQRSSE